MRPSLHDNSGALRRLAERVGILAGYVDQTGQPRETRDATRVGILAALGWRIQNEDDAAAALETLEREERRRLFALTRVVAQSEAGHVALRLPDDWAAEEWALTLTLEQGDAREFAGHVSHDARETGWLSIAIGDVPIGYHRLSASVSGGDELRAADQRLIVHPGACPDPRDKVGDGAFGLIANLYTLRSERNLGIGDVADLEALVRLSASLGGDFVGVNPLHAIRNRGHDISPYSPISRLYRNPIYIAIDRVPELAESNEAQAILARGDMIARIAALRATERVDYERVRMLQRPLLDALHRTFAERHRDNPTPRGSAYRQYVEREGPALETFATWMAIDDHFAEQGVFDCRSWPEPMRMPGSAAVRAFREEHRDEVDLHRWLQFELDRQLADVAATARRAGMRVGLYQDLAIGTSPNSSDVWGSPGLFVTGVSIGAPPDPLAPQGQNWGLPPLDPRALLRTGYDYWARLLRASMRHAGALRIDHVLGLFRQFWIPDGMDGGQGAYIRFPVEDLLGVAALEAARHDALVVGEDLGTVPEDVPPTLARWNVLASRVLWFEREGDTGFKAASRYERVALTTATTHDLPTIDGFWTGRDIELRERAGLLAADEVSAAQAHRARERDALMSRLRADGILPDGAPLEGAELRGAVHSFLRASPSALVGVYVDDLIGERDPVNLPGVPLENYPSWQRRMHASVEELAERAETRVSVGRGRERSG